MAGARVLVADDDLTVARLLGSLVASWGQEPVLVSNGEAALAALEGPSPPGYALIDWMMPGMSGIDVVRAHRRNGGRTRMLLLTARDQKADIVAGLEAGADDYLVKPFDARELRARLFRKPELLRADPVLIEPGCILAGRYRLEEPLGHGGMATVWRATHLELGTTLAIKLPYPDAAPVTIARFEAEARIASQIRSPHIVSIFDYGVTANGIAYLVMEHLRGRTLRELVREVGPLPIQLVAPIAMQLARGLATAHALGVVHRDVKPENVFLQSAAEDTTGAAYDVKLLDFGIARARRDLRPSLSDGNFVGTVGYASPEQIAGEPSPASDVWGLGATMVYALTGRGVIADAGNVAMLVATVSGELLLPSRDRTDLPPGIDEWTQRACAREETDRFPDALTLARSLRTLARVASR